MNILRHFTRDRAPRDPVTVGAAILGGAGSTAIAFGITAQAIVGYIAVSAITSVVLKALAPKQAGGGANSAGILANVMDPIAPHEYVYGKVRKGGVRTYIEATGSANKFLHMILVLAGHEVEAIDDIYINDEIVTLDGSGIVTDAKWKSKIRVKKHLGNQTTADADLIAESSQINSNFIGRGIAYLYIRLEYDQDVFANGIPMFTAGIRGRKVYDPRTSTTGYSSNASLAVRDYLTADFGLNDSAMDDLSFAASANVSDEAIPLAVGGTEARYEVNGIVTADMSPRQVMERMMTTCGGTLFWGQGAWQLHVAYYTAPVTTLTLDDLRSGISLDTRASARDNFNRVTGTFIDASAGYISVDYPALESPTFLAEDYGVQNTLDLQLPMTTSGASAQRLAKLIMFRAREQMTLSADFGMAAFGVQVGDIVAFTNERYGWTAKEFEVAGWKFDTGQDGAPTINLTLRETSEAAFAWDADESAIIANNSNLPDAWSVPGIGISLSSETRVIFEKLTNVIIVDVTTASEGFIERVEVQFKDAASATWNVAGIGSVGKYEIIDVGDAFYDVRVRGYNQFGIRGEWSLYENYQVSGLADPPNDVGSFHGQVYGGTIALEWSPVADLDLSHYKIRYAVEEAGATFANATTAVDKVPRPGSSIVVPARPGTYMIRAIDKTGNSSINYTQTIIPEAAFETFATSLTLTDSPAFSGTKTNTSVTSSELRITSGTSGTYQMSAPIDTGSARRIRARLDVNVNRYDPSLGLFDALPGTFDTIAGLFDDFTGGTSFADTDVLLYIAVSPDAVTYGDWQLFKGGDFYGRAFKFKTELKSDTAGVTPSISGMTARVWHN